MNASKLDIRNAVSMLITADSMKMDSLVEECVQFIHSRLEEILCAHVTFAGVNERLLNKIAFTFTYNELDRLRDKKDKIKSILFNKLVVRLLSPGNSGNSLFMCRECRLILSQDAQSHIRCIPSQLAINHHGDLISLHIKDLSFDVQNYVEIALAELGTWRRVFWHLWGLINVLPCSTCNEYFRCCDVGKCRYHPEDPEYRRHFHDFLPSTSTSPFINYSCCQLKVIRFDPLEINTGCQMHDHTIDGVDFESEQIYSNLLEHRTFVCASVDLQYQKDNDPRLKLRRQSSCMSWSQGIQESENELTTDDESSDETTEGSENQEITKKHLQRIIKWKWNPKHPTRYSQDMQREHEEMKLNKLTLQLTDALLNDKEIATKSQPPSMNGGIFARIESQWKEKHTPAKKNASSSQSTKSTTWKNR